MIPTMRLLRTSKVRRVRGDPSLAHQKTRAPYKLAQSGMDPGRGAIGPPQRGTRTPPRERGGRLLWDTLQPPNTKRQPPAAAKPKVSRGGGGGALPAA